MQFIFTCFIIKSTVLLTILQKEKKLLLVQIQNRLTTHVKNIYALKKLFTDSSWSNMCPFKMN